MFVSVYIIPVVHTGCANGTITGTVSTHVRVDRSDATNHGTLGLVTTLINSLTGKLYTRLRYSAILFD